MEHFEVPMKVASVEKRIEEFYDELTNFLSAFGTFYGYLQTVDISAEIVSLYARMYGVLMNFQKNYPLDFRSANKELTDEELSDLKQKTEDFFESYFKPFVNDVYDISVEVVDIYNTLVDLPKDDVYRVKFRKKMVVYVNYFSDLHEYCENLLQLLQSTYMVNYL